MSLDENMKLALAAAGYARTQIPNSMNYQFTTSPITLDSGDFLYRATQKQMDSVRGKPVKGKTQKEKLHNCAKRAIKARAGNCFEVAIVACEFLAPKGVAPVEL